MIEGSGSGSTAGSGSGSIALTSGSGSGSRWPKNTWIRWIRIRIRNTGKNNERLVPTLTFFTTISCTVIGKTFTESDWRVEKMSENSEGSVRFCPDSSSGPVRFSLDSEKLEEIGKSWRRICVDLLPK
jgi:hypothetical protein